MTTAVHVWILWAEQKVRDWEHGWNTDVLHITFWKPAHYRILAVFTPVIVSLSPKGISIWIHVECMCVGFSCPGRWSLAIALAGQARSVRCRDTHICLMYIFKPCSKYISLHALPLWVRRSWGPLQCHFRERCWYDAALCLTLKSSPKHFNHLVHRPQPAFKHIHFQRLSHISPPMSIHFVTLPQWQECFNDLPTV